MKNEKPLKIAVIGHKRIPSREGGIEIVVYELANRLAAAGNLVDVYNRSGSHVSGARFESRDMPLHKNVRLITVPTPSAKSLNAFVYSFFAAVRALFGGYDVVHFHAEGPAAMCFLPRLFGIRTVVTIHGLDWQRSKWGGFASKYLKFGEKTAAKYADEIIVLSRAVQRYFEEQYGRRTVYIPNGVSKAQPRPAGIITEKWGLKKDGYILFLGRIVPEKGVHYLIEAFSRLNAGLPLVIAGGSSHSQEYFESLKMQAQGQNVIFTDFVQGAELEELYSNAYIYVLPSDLEGMPVSLLEAMSYSNCCLTSDIPECTEVCGENAVYFKKGDVDSLENALRRLLSDENAAAGYKSAAAGYVLSRFSWDETAKKTLSLFRGEPLEDSDSQ